MFKLIALVFAAILAIAAAKPGVYSYAAPAVAYSSPYAYSAPYYGGAAYVSPYGYSGHGYGHSGYGYGHGVYGSPYQYVY